MEDFSEPLEIELFDDSSEHTSTLSEAYSNFKNHCNDSWKFYDRSYFLDEDDVKEILEFQRYFDELISSEKIMMAECYEQLLFYLELTDDIEDNQRFYFDKKLIRHIKEYKNEEYCQRTEFLLGKISTKFLYSNAIDVIDHMRAIVDKKGKDYQTLEKTKRLINEDFAIAKKLSCMTTKFIGLYEKFSEICEDLSDPRGFWCDCDFDGCEKNRSRKSHNFEKCEKRFFALQKPLIDFAESFKYG